ncbi:MAG: filamentous hemagglutinin N-terminal domain-containing protein [Cyanobacteria bacterium SBLK]|nr:filamentous hemagglutinin N-terminal domain-containing protein [Cyanobacteria bacterium SBLK]
MNNTWLENLGRVGLIASLAVAGSRGAIAQIVPDSTLGNENSVVVPINTQLEQIQGGALRGSNLFHSFQEFNVQNGHSAYFVNPALVENIFSRVTGGNISEIFGTLGVLGEANLYLINPNGIIFGENASLDIQGSFVATTASHLVFGDGSEYSAVNPEIPAAIVNNVPIQISLQFEGEPATIVNLGNLSTGESLTLAGGNLDLEGELVAGEDLTLTAEEMVKIRDGESDRFVAAAGNDLLIQGNEGVDIFALNHAESGLFSSGDMILRSNNAVIGDAHYYSGGNFRIEELDGDLGELESPNDPVIRSLGDVSFDSYIGASLHILAGGKVEIPGFIWITGADAVNGLTETVTLFDGRTIEINGKNEPTVDIRAGVDSNFIGSPFLAGTGFFLSPIDTNNTPSSADLNIGTIFFADLTRTNFFAGQVLLTNQYQPNTNLDGNIQIQGSSIFGFGIAAVGGDISLISRGDIALLPNASIFSSGLSGGNIVLDSQDNIVIDNTYILSNNLSDNPNSKSGNIEIFSNSLVAKNGAVVSAISEESANAGDIIFDIQDTLELDGENPIGSVTTIGSSVFGINATGQGGNIKINSGNLFITGGATLTTLVRQQGDGGNIILDIQENVSIDGESRNGQVSSIRSGVAFNAMGNGGFLEIKAKFISVTNGSSILTITSGVGNAGNLNILAHDTISIDGESSNKQQSLVGSLTRLIGNAGNLEVFADNLFLTNGGIIGSSTEDKGETGSIAIDARSIILNGRGSFTSSSIASQIGLDGITSNNNTINKITINTRSLSLQDGGQISTITGGQGDAGNINIKVDGVLSLSNLSGISSSVSFNSIGNSGSIDLTANVISLSEDSVITTGSFGQGNAGNIVLQIEDSITLDQSSLFSDASVGGFGKGGNIYIQTRILNLVNGAQIDASLNSGERFNLPSSRGQGGSINIHATDSVNISGFRSTPFLDPISDFQRSLLPSSNTLRNVQLSTSLEGSSGLFVSAGYETIGEAGKIIVSTRNFNISDGGVVEAITANSSQAGDITINADNFEATRGGQIIATTFGDGKAGNINLNIADRTIFSGNDPTYEDRLARSGQNILANQGASSGLFANTTPDSRGDGGKINVNSGAIELRENAAIAVNSQGEGIGGDIEIHTNRIDLDNSQITAETRSTQGGNIELTVRDLLLMRHGSKISTTAGTAQAGGDGGNITINAENGFLVGPPGEDNDITANAFEGNGGNIDITAQEIFGLKFRDELTPRSDITASSEFGLDGTVQLNTLGIDPNNGLTNLPEDQNDPEVRQGCSQGGANSSSLSIPGRGGAPDNPDDMQIPEFYDEFIPLDELETDGTIEENRENSDRISSEEERPPVLFSCQSN